MFGSSRSNLDVNYPIKGNPATKELYTIDLLKLHNNFKGEENTAENSPNYRGIFSFSFCGLKKFKMVIHINNTHDSARIYLGCCSKK